jgi:Fe-S-cluster containining protein
MSGTNNRQSRCTALRGAIGDGVSCSVYENRPSPCREFAMSGEDGVENDACNRARAHYGLPPLYKDMPFHTGLDAATLASSELQSPPN